MKKKLITLLTCIAIPCMVCGNTPAGKPNMLAGTAKTNMTPAAEPVHDSLYARCPVLALEGRRYAFVAVDLHGMASGRVKQICREKLTGLMRNETVPSGFTRGMRWRIKLTEQT
jgi:hypothetical protein